MGVGQHGDEIPTSLFFPHLFTLSSYVEVKLRQRGARRARQMADGRWQQNAAERASALKGLGTFPFADPF